MPTLQHAGLPHRNLFVLDSNIFENDFIEGIYPQGFFKNGFVARHNHRVEKLTEIIHLTQGSVYAGMNARGIQLINNEVYVVKKDMYYPAHGSPVDISSGQWLSIKTKDYNCTHVTTRQYNSGTYFHLFSTPSKGGFLTVVSNNLDSLERVIGKPAFVIGVPTIQKFISGF